MKDMDTSEEPVQVLSPPTDIELEIKDKWFMILEVLWMTLQIIPQIILSVIRKVFGRPKSLRGQVALVTGAGRGLGKGLALALAQEGCKVAVADVDLTSAEETAEEIRQAGGNAKAYSCNVAKVEEVKKLRAAISKDFGIVELLVNNAGLIFGNTLEGGSEEDIFGVISVNLLSHFWMVKEFLPAMREHNSGHIVAIASVASYMGGADGSAYVASKFGVKGFMESVRCEVNRHPNNKIKTTTVCPYFINTSASYIQQWDLRLPAMSIRTAVNATISAIKKEEVLITIPGHYHYVMHLFRFLPQTMFDKLTAIFYAKIIFPPKEVKTLTTVIIKDLAKNKHI